MLQTTELLSCCTGTLGLVIGLKMGSEQSMRKEFLVTDEPLHKTVINSNIRDGVLGYIRHYKEPKVRTEIKLFYRKIPPSLGCHGVSSPTEAPELHS